MSQELKIGEVVDGTWRVIAALPRKITKYVCEACRHLFDFTGSNHPASCPRCSRQFIGIDERNQPSIGMVESDNQNG